MKLRSTTSTSRLSNTSEIQPNGRLSNFPKNSIIKRCFGSGAVATLCAATGCIATFALVSLFVYQRKLIWIGQRSNGQMFSAADPREVPGTHQVITLSPDKVGCYFPPAISSSSEIDNTKTLVYFHGNGDQVGWGGMFLGQSFSSKGFGFFAIEYPGYGIAEGFPQEKSIFDASESLLEFIELKHNIKRDSMILVGQSIGSAAALEMAKRGFGSKLILVSPFLNLHLMAVETFPFLKPLLGVFPFFLKDKLDNAKVASKINISSLILHGTRDDIVPFEHGSRLATLFPKTAHCKFVPLNGAAHNNMFVGRYLDLSIRIIEDFAMEK